MPADIDEGMLFEKIVVAPDVSHARMVKKPIENDRCNVGLLRSFCKLMDVIFKYDNSRALSRRKEKI
jgi:hypothetical protein